MKLYLTQPYDPNGIEEIETTWGPDESGSFGWAGGTRSHHGWYVEGHSFHRTREAAIAKARECRAAWIEKTTREAARVAALPQITG